MEYIGKGGWISRRYSPGRCKQYYFPTLSKMIEKLENQEFTNRKDVAPDLMREMAPGNLLRFYVYFGKSKGDVGSKKRSIGNIAGFRAYF